MFKTRSGSALFLSIGLCLFVSILAFVLQFLSANEWRMAENQRKKVIAFYIAEAGVERAINDLRQDFANGSSWTDGDINGWPINLNNSFQTLPYTNTNLNNGVYTVEVSDGDNPSEIWIRSSGVFEGVTQRILVYGQLERLSIWDNAIYAGTGQSGQVINGNVNIRGSVHVLGNSLVNTDSAIELNGSAMVAGNNYDGMEQYLFDKVPALETVTFGGESVQTLHSELRVKHGNVKLDGTAKVGDLDSFGNLVKETADGAYVSDGYIGNSGGLNVYADVKGVYDLGSIFSFPSLSTAYGGFATYREYFQTNALALTNELAAITPDSVFNYADSNGSISMDGAGNLAVAGCVYVSGNVNMDKQGNDNTITYQGKGTILATGDVAIDVNLITLGNNSFPNSLLAIMTPNDIRIGQVAQLDVMGLFYAEGSVKLSKQTDIVGTIVSNYFDLGNQVPAVYQVPSTLDNLPPRLIGANPFLLFRIISWQRI